MRTALVTELEGPDGIEVRELDTPAPRKGQVIIEVDACGVNFPDLLLTRGLYQIRPRLPFAPGAEISGKVSAIGEGVTSVAVGDQVMALNWYGGFSTHVAVAQQQALPIPETMPLETAAAFAFTYGTSMHALVDRARLQAGERLLVLGAAGGVGLAAVEIGAALGADVIAAASTEEKLDLCVEHGATKRINYATEDLRKVAKKGGGIDVVYDPVGGDYSEKAIRALRQFGRHLVIGFASGVIPTIPLNLTLLRQSSIVGVAWGEWALLNRDRHAAHMRTLFAIYAEGKLRPHVSKRYTLDEAAQALRDMDQRKVKGKIVIRPND